MSRIPVGAYAATRVRSYERDFDWTYMVPPLPPLRELIPVVWDGLWLNTGDQGSGLCAVVTNVEGWLDSPPLDGNDVARVISDGAAWGPKTLGPRTVVISGKASGPREELGLFRDQLARRAAAREPALLAVGDWDLQRVLTADVRAGTEQFRVTWIGSSAFRWQVALTAADPALSQGTWQTAELTNVTEATGRDYPKDYPWRYAGMIPNTTLLRNGGNHDAPVYASYTGDLTESLLTDGIGGIRVATVQSGVQILVATATLTAEALGGYSRASMILPGSRPMVIAAGASVRWTLRAAGRGSVVLAWRSTWV
jgi:hypothetical protein